MPHACSLYAIHRLLMSPHDTPPSHRASSCRFVSAREQAPRSQDETGRRHQIIDAAIAALGKSIDADFSYRCRGACFGCRADFNSHAPGRRVRCRHLCHEAGRRGGDCLRSRRLDWLTG